MSTKIVLLGIRSMPTACFQDFTLTVSRHTEILEIFVDSTEPDLRVRSVCIAGVEELSEQEQSELSGWSINARKFNEWSKRHDWRKLSCGDQFIVRVMNPTACGTECSVSLLMADLRPGYQGAP